MVAAFDRAGEVSLRLLSHITDRMGVQIALLTAVFALILFLTLYRVPHLPRVALGPVSMAFVLWIQYVVERMPMVHERMHLALATTAGIIQASEDYLASFVSRSGIGETAAGDSGNIASFLYYLTAGERDAWTCNPQDLYTHLFRTMDHIRGMGVFPDVHESLWGTWAIVLPVLLTLFLVLAATERKEGGLQKAKLYWLLLQVLFLWYAVFQSMGMFLCVSLLWVLETILLSMLPESRKKRNQVPFSQKRENKS